MSETTKAREWRHTDKSAWGDGPWQQEPDKVQWVDEATGLDCLIVRGPAGALCGYVGVPESHPWFGVEYGSCTVSESGQCGDENGDGGWCDHRPESLIQVHGGLTFSDLCQEDAIEGHGICHIAEPGRPEKVWWFGFDCAHCYDLTPKPSPVPFWRDRREADRSYRTREYVAQQCASLAVQLAAQVPA